MHLTFFQSWQIVTVILVAIAMSLSLAHALEWPGKMRLDRNTYVAVQTIYYPGFSIGGISEPLSILSTLVLLILAPAANAGFWLTLTALLSLAVMHLVFWLVTQPANKFWLVDQNLSELGVRFFGTASGETPDWIVLRDRWEGSHLVRAVFAALAFVLLLIAAIG